MVIDEAQALPVESIEALRLMTNLETESRKLLQVVLFGQPELNQKLSMPELRQLKQRITFSYSLSHMDTDQIYHYVKHRLVVAGHPGEEVFDVACCRLMFMATKGTPRLVNILCHKAMMLAYGEGKYKVDVSHIKLAIADTEATTLPWYASLALWPSLVAAGAVVSVTLASMLEFGGMA